MLKVIKRLQTLHLVPPCCVSHQVSSNRFGEEITAERNHHRLNKCCNSLFLDKFCGTRGTRSFSTKSSSEYGDKIYTGPINKQILFVKSLSVSSSCVGLFIQSIFIDSKFPFMAKIASETEMTWIQTFSELSAGSILISQLFLLPLILSPLLLHWIAKRYVVEIFYNNDTKVYTVYRYSFFGNRRKMQFTAEEVQNPKASRAILTTCEVNGKPILFDTNPNKFQNKIAYFELVKNLTEIMDVDQRQEVTWEDIQKQMSDEDTKTSSSQLNSSDKLFNKKLSSSSRKN